MFDMKTLATETNEANKENKQPQDSTGAIILPPPFAPVALLEVPSRASPVVWSEPGPPAPVDTGALLVVEPRADSLLERTEVRTRRGGRVVVFENEQDQVRLSQFIEDAGKGMVEKNAVTASFRAAAWEKSQIAAPVEP